MMLDPFSLAYFGRKPQVSAAYVGENLQLFNPDCGLEKCINATGRILWDAMDGTVQVKDLAQVLVNHYGAIPTDLEADARTFAEELVRTGFATCEKTPSQNPLPVEKWIGLHEVPHQLFVSLTGRCNLRCAYCYFADEMVGRRDLSTECWLDFFRELKGVGMRSLTLSGGEIFMRPDLWELVDGIVDARMRFAILTNGTLLTDENLVELSKPSRRRRLDSIQVSIDGSCAEIHDASRGKGCFEKALHGLRQLKARGFPVTVRVTVNRHNVDDLENVARLLLEDVGLQGFSTNDAIAMGTGCARRDDICLLPAQRVTAMETLVRLSQKYGGRISATAGSLALWRMFRDMEKSRDTDKLAMPRKMGCLSSCGCMFSKLAVHHDGMIVPCNMLAAASLGEMGEVSLASIWQDHPLLVTMRTRRRIHMQEIPGCATCEWAPYCCGGCPAPIYTQTGDMNLPAPDCCYRLFLEETGAAGRAVVRAFPNWDS